MKAEAWQQKGGHAALEGVPIKRLLTFGANGKSEHPIGNAHKSTSGAPKCLFRKCPASIVSSGGELLMIALQ